MDIEYPSVETKQYRTEVARWLHALARGEHVSVMFVPKTDRLRRLQQLLAEPEFIKKIIQGTHAFIFQSLDFDPTDIEFKEDLYEHISMRLNSTGIVHVPMKFEEWLHYLKKHNYRLVLVLVNAEKFISSVGRQVLTHVSDLADRMHPLVTVLSFYEMDISHSAVLPLLPASTSLFENTYQYPLYEAADVRHFLTYLQKKWNATMKKSDEDKIITECGGHLWLVKQAARYVLVKDFAYSEKSIEEAMKFRLRVIMSLMSTTEQQVLRKIVTGDKHFTQPEKESMHYLTHMRVLTDKGTCAIGMLPGYIMSESSQDTRLVVNQENMMINSIPLETIFSRKEYRVVKILLMKRGVVVPRDEIAQAIWPTNTQEQYSDWAIDQLISRVRKRLTSIAIHPKLLRSVRGKGYVLSEK